MFTRADRQWDREHEINAAIGAAAALAGRAAGSPSVTWRRRAQTEISWISVIRPSVTVKPSAPMIRPMGAMASPGGAFHHREPDEPGAARVGRARARATSLAPRIERGGTGRQGALSSRSSTSGSSTASSAVEVAVARRAARKASTTCRWRPGRRRARRRALDPAAGPAGQLPGRGRGAVQDRGDLLERHGEHVVQHERQPLGRGQRVQHHQQRQPDRVGQQRLVLGVAAVGAG